jgi:hypothetical protein
VNTAYFNDVTTIGERLTDISLSILPPPSANENVLIQTANQVYAQRTLFDLPNPDTDQYDLTIIIPYNNDVILRMDNPYLPTLLTITPLPELFTISDELELRNRFCLNSNSHTTLENIPNMLSYLVNGVAQNLYTDQTTWFKKLLWISTEKDRRHFLTTYSWDRTIRGYSTDTTAPVAGFATPSTGTTPPITLEGLQADINNATAEEIATSLIYTYQNSTFGDVDQRKRVAQFACNIVDYRDEAVDVNNEVSYLYYASNGTPGTEDSYVFGHEPQPYISAIISKIHSTNPETSGNNEFKVRLYNPYSQNLTDISDFVIHIYDGITKISETTLSGSLTTLTETAEVTVGDFATFVAGPAVDKLYTIALLKEITVTSGTEYALIDKWECPDIGAEPDWLNWDDTEHEITRNTSDWQVVCETAPVFNYNLDIPELPFFSVGEVSNVLTIGPAWFRVGIDDVDAVDTMGEILSDPTHTVATGRLDLEANLEEDQNLLSHLTVLTRIDGIDNIGVGTTPDNQSELRIPGRININTAPARVLAALPWIQDPTLPNTSVTDREDRLKLAQAIVAYRDKTELLTNIVDYYQAGAANSRRTGMGSTNPNIREDPGFANIAELVNVTHDASVPAQYDELYDIRKHFNTAGDLATMPDLTPSDAAIDDLEERDVLFQRVSNLVTVRSDVFTAYIAVRVGEYGPMRRYIAIFDRSNVFRPTDTPKLVALHPVPDPS